jgi:RimJ/RimL family protein N-acetyltransferase
VFLRVLPDNVVAQRAYAAAGFARVSPQLEQEWNSGQPAQYVWMAR